MAGRDHQKGQNRQESSRENLNSGADYRNTDDLQDPGEMHDKEELSREIGVGRDEIGSVRETGALSGRQDLAGGSAGDKTETSGYTKDTEDSRGGGGTGDSPDETQHQQNRKNNQSDKNR